MTENLNQLIAALQKIRKRYGGARKGGRMRVELHHPLDIKDRDGKVTMLSVPGNIKLIAVAIYPEEKENEYPEEKVVVIK
jgi:hypothetical protein